MINVCLPASSALKLIKLPLALLISNKCMIISSFFYSFNVQLSIWTLLNDHIRLSIWFNATFLVIDFHVLHLHCHKYIMTLVIAFSNSSERKMMLIVRVQNNANTRSSYIVELWFRAVRRHMRKWEGYRLGYCVVCFQTLCSLFLLIGCILHI